MRFFKYMGEHLLKMYWDDTLALAKIRAVRLYVTALGEARQIFIRYVILRFALLLMIAGFSLIHIAFFLYVPLSREAKMLLLLIFGIVYFLISLAIILVMTSEKYWMKLSGASKLVKDIAKERRMDLR
jgi:hypothetical protein